jgi:hypothetical protein
MIRWCSYCQSFLGESPPYDDVAFTHGICESCEQRVLVDDALVAATEPVRRLMRRILEKARGGEELACAAMVGEAKQLGLGVESVLIGLLQPALYKAGLDWQEDHLSAAAEERFTSWCEGVFALVPPPRPCAATIDLLILQAPGNLHTLGPRFAARVLSERSLSVVLADPVASFEQIVSLAALHRPRAIGISCAQPCDVRAARALVERLRGRLATACRYVLAGYALRTGNQIIPGVEVAPGLEHFAAAWSAPRMRR